MKKLLVAISFIATGSFAGAVNFFPRLDVTGSTVSVSGSITTTGGLTNTELRASSVAVTGPLTDTQLRATAVPISVSSSLSTVEVAISTVGTPTTVSISTSAWTMVPASSSLANREGIVLSIPSTLNANVVGHKGNCTSTAIATTVRPMEFIKGNGFVVLPYNNDVCLWLLSLHTAAESVHVQEFGQ